MLQVDVVLRWCAVQRWSCGATTCAASHSTLAPLIPISLEPSPRARAKYTVLPGGLFQRWAPPRQDVDEAAERHLELIRSRTMADSGCFFDWQGQEVPW